MGVSKAAMAENVGDPVRLGAYAKRTKAGARAVSPSGAPFTVLGVQEDGWVIVLTERRHSIYLLRDGSGKARRDRLGRKMAVIPTRVAVWSPDTLVRPVGRRWGLLTEERIVLREGLDHG